MVITKPTVSMLACETGSGLKGSLTFFKWLIFLFDNIRNTVR